ncbi:Fatty acyl-CoA elongase/Polyunsaturated fatty acid specific elongation enzyme [Entomophthora muscae]|uniref:Fatty acyl-CoA elongase/Polyunsaturated fatty acid specific elongation enzyme n=1 Tax=Entomophthora muscae TaxID=34485 RepID=A0ACC2SZ72_9FUNG|nr:Fatty acyl-CoA elongase/Polyunsaturated fatty acid specific elongation enzyme [Entomophthora muscae]
MATQYLSPQAWFESGYEKVVGTPASEFRYTPGTTFMSTNREVLPACFLYLVVILGGQRIMKPLKPFKMATAFRIHNAFLTLASFVLWVLFLENVIPLFKEGLFNSFCSPQAYTQRLELLYYLNYLTKYYELLDTCFLVLRKKKLEFLHLYHHSMTAFLCFTQLEGQTSISWVPIVLNLGVHVIMYSYYLLATFNIQCWWKKYITATQITQFVTDLAVFYVGVFSDAAFYSGALPSLGPCSGSLKSMYFGTALITSYLFLFVEFYNRVYSKLPAKEN